VPALLIELEKGVRRHGHRHPGLADRDRHAPAARRRSRVELASFVWPDHEPGSPTAMANELGLRSICFEVDDLQAAVDGLAANGYGLVGGIGQHEGIVVSLTERID
jgi:hypothetical protein